MSSTLMPVLFQMDVREPGPMRLVEMLKNMQ